MKIIVTGGAGFIGSNFIYYMMEKHSEDQIICLDALTYAGHMSTLEVAMKNPAFRFVKASVTDRVTVYRLFEEEHPDIVVNFAAESHVDRSIENPEVFLDTNIKGTAVLMDACRKYGIWRYHQVSTDEVYGDLPLERPDLFFYRRDADPYEQSVQCIQGSGRSSGTVLSQNVWTSGYNQPLFQQLWTISSAGKADSADDRRSAS